MLNLDGERDRRGEERCIIGKVKGLGIGEGADGGK